MDSPLLSALIAHQSDDVTNNVMRREENYQLIQTSSTMRRPLMSTGDGHDIAKGARPAHTGRNHFLVQVKKSLEPGL